MSLHVLRLPQFEQCPSTSSHAREAFNSAPSCSVNGIELKRGGCFGNDLGERREAVHPEITDQGKSRRTTVPGNSDRTRQLARYPPSTAQATP